MKKLLPLILLALLSSIGYSQTVVTGSANRILKGGTLPATCSVGDIFYMTGSAPSSGQYNCTASNTWTKVGTIGSLPTSTYSSLPTCSSGNDGQLYRVTDANRDVYSCYGTSGKWISRNGGVYNVKDFGVIGDAVNNDTDAFQAAMDAANAAGGGVVWIPSNTTVIVHGSSNPFYMKSHVRIVGQSQSSSKISANATFTHPVIQQYGNGDNNPNNYTQHGSLENLTVLMNTTSSVVCLSLLGSRNFYISNVDFMGAGTSQGQTAIALLDDNDSSTSSKSCFFTRIQAVTTSSGWGTFLKVRQIHGNANSFTIESFNANARVAFDFTEATGFDMASVFDQAYLTGDDNAASAVFASNSIPTGLSLRLINYEGYTLTPTVDTFFYQPTSSSHYSQFTNVKASRYEFVGATIAATNGGTTTLVLSSANFQTVTMPSGNTTLTASGVPTGLVYIDIVQDATGGRTVTWNSLFKFSGGTKPTLTATGSARDSFIFKCDGTNCYLLSAVYDLK